VTNLVTVTDIQFSGSDAVSAKLRRLVHDLAAAESAINALINSVAALAASESAVGPFLLATTTGLGPDFKVGGLTEGLVLKAISATNAAFQALALTDLGDVAISMAVNGQVLTFLDGQWVNADSEAGSGGANGVNLGSGVGVFAGISSGKLAFKSFIGDGATISVQDLGTEIEFSGMTNPATQSQSDAMAYFNGF